MNAFKNIPNIQSSPCISVQSNGDMSVRMTELNGLNCGAVSALQMATQVVVHVIHFESIFGHKTRNLLLGTNVSDSYL